MKFYKTDSYKEAAQMAAEDVNKWNEEERRQLGLIASKELPENKKIINLSTSGDCRNFALEGEVYRFHNSAHGMNIKKLLPSPLSQFSDEQLANELRRRGWNYILTEVTDLEMIEGRKIKTSSLF